MPVTSRLVAQSTVGFLLVGFLALLAIVGMTFWLGERAQFYFADVIAARDTRAAAVELRNAVLTAESSQRGFLLTGNEIYLAPYDTAKALAERQLATLRDRLGSDKQSDLIVQRLTNFIGQKFQEMDQTIALKRDRHDEVALAIIRSNRGKALSDEANVFFAGIIRSADDRLTTGVGEQQRNAALLRTVSLVGGLVIVLVVAAAAVTLLRYTRELRAARDEVAGLNAGLEARVEERTADLARANDEIRRFAHIVSHDLRAPLVNIMGFTAEIESSAASLQALVDRSGSTLDTAGPLAGEARTAAADLEEAVGFIRSSTEKMDRLIGAILKLSREGRRTLQPQEFDLAAIVDASVAAIQHQIQEANGTIQVDVHVPPMHSDRLSVEQIVGNLLDNAVKYRARGRPLRIEVRARTASEDRLAIEIADNGRGIAERDRERVFDLFGRAGEQDQPGEGIGLAYVRTLVRNLGGRITLTSEANRGTTFLVVLPRVLRLPDDTNAGAA